MEEERQLDLLDLLSEMIKHWKGAIILFLIGIMVLIIYDYVQSPATTITDIDADEEAVLQQMSYADKKAVDVVLEYEKLYIQAKDSGDIENLIAINKTVIDSVKNFDELQLIYFTANSVSDLWGNIPITSLPPLPSEGMSKKTMLLGGIALSFLYLIFWAVKYIFDGHIKVTDDLMSLVQVPQLGFISLSAEPKFIIDKWAYRLKHHGKRDIPIDKSYEIIAANISANAQKRDIKEVTIICDMLEGKACECCNRLLEIITSQYQLKANVVYDVVYNQKSISMMSESKSAVFVETVGNALYTDLYKEMQFLSQLDIPVLGGVVVE